MADQTPYTWEQMLKVFAGTDHSDVVKRTDVTGADWIQAYYLITDTKSNNDRRKVQNGIAKGDAGYDMWAEWVYLVEGGGTYSTILGVTCNWPFWDGKEGDATATLFTRFKSNPGDILGPSIWGNCTGNEVTAPPTLWDASRIVGEVDTFFVEQRKKVNTWFNDVGGSDSEFQGTAAGRFKEVLYGLENEFLAMHFGLSGDLGAYKGKAGDPPAANPIVTKLKDAGDALRAQQAHMYTSGYEAWRGNSTLESAGPNSDKGEHWQYTDGSAGGSFSSPYTCVHFAFTELVKNFTAVLTLTTISYDDGSLSADATVSGNGVTLATTKDGVNKESLGAFVKQLDAKAKEKWNAWVVDKLDAAATTAGRALSDAYDAASRLLLPIRPVTLDLPKDKVETPDGKGGDGNGPKTDVSNPNLGGGAGGDGGGTGGGGTGGIGGTGGGTGGIGGIGGGTGGGSGGGSGGKGGKTGGIGGTGGGGSTGMVPLLDKDGKPLLDKDGKPQMVPPGTRVNDKGQLVDKDGKPLLDKDGKPRQVPAGTVVGQPGTGSGGSTTGSGGTGSSSSTPFKVPPGSKRNDDGTVTTPDGTLLKDRNGNPVVLGKDRTIGEDGTVRDANGRPVSQFEQLLTDEEYALSKGVGDIRTGGGGGGWSGNWSGLPGSIGGSGVSFGSGGSGDGAGSVRTGSGLFGEPVGGGGAGPKTVGGIASGPPGLGVGGRLAEAMGVKPTAVLAAEEAAASRATAAGRAAAGAAAEEAQLMGRGMSTTGGMGGPMVPPMGAGAGGAPGQGEKERQRTTWLAEDEEVWGTDSDAVTGVIGR
ncbi:hypothetical protein ACIQOW_14290 [Kitasatospora sp. NPDC091335]|uniref:hypothetical protein n=1 Tax=Kitasatospora sp. NPDC091335 TaxID=3364085 RepID=UPI00381B411B